MRIKWFSLVRVTGLLLVLLYHFFKGIFPGGFIGVDVFFAFSGFLITALLIDEFTKKQTIDYQAFLRRRFYRIVPPMVFMLLAVMPLTFLVRPDFIASIGTQILASIGFVTNFYEMLSGGNYESQFIPHLFVHTWSLAIEVHYYILWALGAWFLSKKVKKAGQFRGLLFLSSLVLFLLSALAMTIGAFLTDNFSSIYFSTFTHVFPFFIGSALATLTGINNTTGGFKKLTRNWDTRKVLTVFAGSFGVLLLLTFILHFENRLTYAVGFLIASIAATSMILSARLLHEKTPDLKEPAIITFIADTSYGVYLFHWPLYIIFSQRLDNIWAVLLTLLLSFALAALSFYLLEPVLLGRPARIFGVDLDLKNMMRPVFYIAIPLTLCMLVVVLIAPKVGSFETSLNVQALNQSQERMALSRRQVDKKMASNYNVAEGDSLIGDSVALRASDYIKEVIPTIDIDASVSRNLTSGLEVFENGVDNHVLNQNVIVALGANTTSDYKATLDKMVKDLPKGSRLIFITPYDGRFAGNDQSEVMQIRAYMLELSENNNFVYIADWYSTAAANPQIWGGTDNVHFGSESSTIQEGGRLYANTLKKALDEANKGAIKK